MTIIIYTSDPVIRRHSCVSGAPPGKSEKESIDGACAKAGVDAIQSELNFGE